MLSIRPVSVARASSRFDIVKVILDRVGRDLKDRDVLVISSKYIAISEGRIASLGSVTPGVRASGLAGLYRMDPRLCELILRESDFVVGGVPGFILASWEGLLTPNAGIDKSNIEHGMVVLYPRRPELSARRIRDAIRFETGADVAAVVSDSRLMPTRRGTTGVALASDGLEAITDLRGKSDLFGNVLKVTSQAIADDLCSAAQLLMGESDEAVPVVLVRGLDGELFNGDSFDSASFSIPADACVYLRSLGYGI